jgi:hypothetical protein
LDGRLRINSRSEQRQVRGAVTAQTESRQPVVRQSIGIHDIVLSQPHAAISNVGCFQNKICCDLPLDADVLLHDTAGPRAVSVEHRTRRIQLTQPWAQT